MLRNSSSSNSSVRPSIFPSYDLQLSRTSSFTWKRKEIEEKQKEFQGIGKNREVFNSKPQEFGGCAEKKPRIKAVLPHTVGKNPPNSQNKFPNSSWGWNLGGSCPSTVFNYQDSPEDPCGDKQRVFPLMFSTRRRSSRQKRFPLKMPFFKLNDVILTNYLIEIIILRLILNYLNSQFCP